MLSQKHDDIHTMTIDATMTSTVVNTTAEKVRIDATRQDVCPSPAMRVHEPRRGTRFDANIQSDNATTRAML